MAQTTLMQQLSNLNRKKFLSMVFAAASLGLPGELMVPQLRKIVKS
jgi:hypothetical protein